jgi:hypothetical protein
VREQDARVPVEVEQYLIGLYARAGQVGGSLGGAGDGGARGGARGAARLRTVVEDRTVSTSTPGSGVPARVTEAFPQAERISARDDVLRLAIPLGRTGLQRIVVDVRLAGPTPEATQPVLVRAYGKEGLLSRKPTARIADQVAQLLAN